MADPVVLVFTFPMPDNIANARQHWAMKHRRKNTLWGLCDVLVKGKILPMPPKDAPWTKATISSRMVVGNSMDHDNAIARHKPLLDWLVTRGYLLNDTRKCLDWTGFPAQKVSRKNLPEIEITLTKVA